MSISKVHELIQNKGCVWTISIIMALSMIVGGFATCGRDNQNPQLRRLDPGAVIAKVGDYEVTEGFLSEEVQRTVGMYGGLVNMSPQQQLQQQAGALRGIVGYVIMIDMAKKYGIKASDQDIEKVLSSEIEQEFMMEKQRFIMQGKLKAESTEAEFAEVFKKEHGHDVSQLKKDSLAAGMARVKSSPDTRLGIEAKAINLPLMDAVQKETKLSDEDLKKSYDQFQVKRIMLIKGDPLATAKKIEAELKGGLTFEKAMDRYSETPAEPNKKVSDKVDPWPRTSLQAWDVLRPLEKLKVGEVSAPITVGDTVSLFKLVGIKSELPKDFEAKKEEKRKEQIATVAAGKLQSDLMAAQKVVKIDWRLPVYEMLYEYGRLGTETMNPDERSQLARKIMDESLKAVTEGDAAQAKLASLLALITFEDVYSKASPAEKTKLDEKKIEIYEAYLLDNEDPDMRLEIVRVYQSQKRGQEFADQLTAAANGNLGGTDAKAQSIYAEINKLIREGEESKLLTPDQVKPLKDIQQQWVVQKAEQDKWDAEQKKQEEEARKAAEEEERKAKEEAAKQAKTREELEKEKKAKAGGAK